MRIPFAIQSYQSRSLSLSAQRLVNFYAERPIKEAKAPIALFGTPGLKFRTVVGTGKIRGLHQMGGLLYVLSGTEVYKVDRVNNATLMGEIPGVSNVQMEDNGTQIMVLAGPTTNDGYVITENDVNQITDPDFPGGTSLAFLDQYLVLTVPNSAQFAISALADVTSWDALDFATAEADPDLLVRCFVDHRELWLMGEESTEIWVDTGASPFPLERQSGSYLERGILGVDSVAKLDNTVYWLGDDRIVYRADAYIPKRISTHAIERVLSDQLDLSDVRSFVYTQDGHPFYVLKKPGVFTFVYDVATQLWHERLSTINDVLQQDWRVSHYVRAFDRNLVADDLTSNIYELDLDTFTENGEPIRGSATAPNLWAQTKRARMNSLIIDFDPGVGLTLGQGSNPQAMVDWSDDGGLTWSNEHWRDIGKIGEYERRARWNRMGQFRQRVLRVTVSDPVKRVILGAYAEIDGGRL